MSNIVSFTTVSHSFLWLTDVANRNIFGYGLTMMKNWGFDLGGWKKRRLQSRLSPSIMIYMCHWSVSQIHSLQYWLSDLRCSWYSNSSLSFNMGSIKRRRVVYSLVVCRSSILILVTFWIRHQMSISSTLYARVFRTNVVSAAFF